MNVVLPTQFSEISLAMCYIELETRDREGVQKKEERLRERLAISSCYLGKTSQQVKFNNILYCVMA